MTHIFVFSTRTKQPNVEIEKREKTITFHFFIREHNTERRTKTLCTRAAAATAIRPWPGLVKACRQEEKYMLE